MCERSKGINEYDEAGIPAKEVANSSFPWSGTFLRGLKKQPGGIKY